MIVFSAILHPYGVFNECLTESCKPWHSKWKYMSRSSVLLINCAAILPCVGQVVGIFMIAAAIKDYKQSTDEFEKVESASYLCRGVLTLLGLGILCFLLDIIVSCAVLIKNFIIENTNEFERC